MKHHVTPDTALKLKEAGYPQPETPEGLFLDGLLNPDYEIECLAYMPTATEIMEQPEMLDCVISYHIEFWRVSDLGCADHENPAEAAAELYLKIKQQ